VTPFVAQSNAVSVRKSTVIRGFCSSDVLYKKSGKKVKDTTKSDSSPPGPSVAPNTATDDVFDFSPLETKILEAIEKLTHDLAKLRAGGRFNPENLETLKVQLGKAGNKENVKLGDLAQVIPRGRNISVVVGDVDVRIASSKYLIGV